MRHLTKVTGLFLMAALAIGGVQAKTSTHQRVHQELLANQNKVKLVDKYDFVDFGDNYSLGSTLSDSESDILMDEMDSRRVNPFKESQVPESKIINISKFHMPVPGRVTSNYGYRPRFGRMHKGVDLALKVNDTVRAAFDGQVRLTNYEAKGYGKYIIIRHNNGLETIYGHLNKHLVKDGDVVKAGDPIGLGGNTGRSTGPHLHFETRYMGYAINPAGIFDFENQTVHSEEYLFTKKTYASPKHIEPGNPQLAGSEELKADDGLAGKETSQAFNSK